MARARNIKPGFFKNEDLADLDPLTRILFIGLWCLADRDGRLEDRPKRIRAEILPYDDGSVEQMLSDLHSAGFIQRYVVENQAYISICNFVKHQNPHCKEAVSTIPEPCKHGASTVQEPKQPGESTEVAGLIPDSGFLIPDSGSPQTDAERAPTAQGEICKAIRAAGVQNVNPSHPDLLALIQAGATHGEFKHAAFEAVKKGKASFAYVLGVVKGRRNDAAQQAFPTGHLPERPRSLGEERAETIAKLTGANRNERSIANERDITGESVRVA